jgi:hypothetical protein
VYWLLALTPLWALLGIRLIVIPGVLLIVGAAVLLAGARRPLWLPLEGVFLAGFIGAQGLAVLLNGLSMPSDRLVSTANILVIWLCGFVAFLLSTTGDERSIRGFAWMLVVLGTTSGLVAVVGLALWVAGVSRFAITSPLVSLPGGALLAETSRIVFVFTEHFAGRPVPRMSGFALFPTALAALVGMSLLATFYLAKTSGRWGLAAVLGVIQALPFILSFARMAVLGLAVGAIAWLLMAKGHAVFRRVGVRLVILLVVLGTYVGFAGLVISLTISDERFSTAGDVPAIGGLITSVLSAREGSTTTRGALYLATIDEIEDHLPWGLGYKPRDERFPVALGTHSTVLSLALRAGVPGIGLALLFLTAVLWRLFSRLAGASATARHNLLFLGACVVSIAVWLVTDDLDAPQEVALPFFLAAGLICGAPLAGARGDHEPS